MPRSGPPTYNYVLPPIYLAVPGTTIIVDQHNTPLQDIADTFNSITPIVWGGTGANTAAGAQTALGFAYLSWLRYPTAGGTADALTLAPTDPLLALTNQTPMTMTAAADNTGAATLNVSSVGVRAIRKIIGGADVALQAGDLREDVRYGLVYDTAANSAAGAWIITSGLRVFPDANFRLQDEADPTKQVAFEASGLTTATTRTMTVPDVSGTLTLLDAPSQPVTGGATVAALALNSGSPVTSGTLTLDMGARPFQAYTNGGAHTLAPGTPLGYCILDITNDGSAGAITTSGWTKVVGSFTTTNGHKFRCSCSVGAAGSLLSIQALQ